METQETIVQINWWEVALGLAGGLALFLYGMVQMTNGLKAAAGNRLTNFLAKMTRNRWTSLTAGAGITAVIQSSSITTVLVVGFVSAGLMEFSKTLGIILGANIGTTITAQIIAFKVTESALLIVAVGYVLTTITKFRRLKNYGYILLGLGLVFLGMNLMTRATMPLRSFEPFMEVMKNTALPVYGILFGAFFTALVQSSSATTGVVIVLASQGLLNIETGVAMIIGANIGTCVTALLAAIGKPRPAVQVALAHVLFNSLGAIIFAFLIPQLSELVADISKNDVGRQIANAHTIFNIGNALLFIGFTKSVAHLIKRILPDKAPADRTVPLLDDYYLKHANLALDMVEKTLKEMGQDLVHIASDSIPLAIRGTRSNLDDLRKRDDILDSWHERILSYISQIQQKELSEHEMERVRRQTDIANIIENAGDLYTTSVVEAAEHRLKLGFEVSEETHKMLLDLYEQANAYLADAITAFQEKDKPKAESVTESKDQFAEDHAKVHRHVYSRLGDSEEHRVSIIRFEVELLEVARRLHSLARRIARRAIGAIEKDSIKDK
ncbi:Na/Pi-cotransporter II-related protein [Salinivirga cyanobacteriivorans]|uniref:Na/Pi-cotransporter II-related protein n=1 Tax=Salinivirga cyanobacteriivorans TaxID=1307839 RepID=A0A0S2HZH9_9BACT|nr:Na/Pi cotransporter family protein [Salinivirga cyanobacteriivorans]ALO15466.1 Na/Pi-cotransporter II-related protein [Salinivirga cyanobacteriivorans]